MVRRGVGVDHLRLDSDSKFSGVLVRLMLKLFMSDTYGPRSFENLFAFGTQSPSPAGLLMRA